MMRVKLIGLNSYDNLGDQILRDTCEFLAQKAAKDIEEKKYSFEKMDMMPRTEGTIVNLLLIFLLRIFCKCGTFRYGRACYSTRFFDWIRNSLFKLKYYHYYVENLKDINAIIFVGGAYLKFKGEDFQYCIRNLISIAQEQNISVMFNAIGVEGYDEEDIRCVKLKECIEQPCVKVVTTRDDIQTLQSKFAKNAKCTTNLVGDPALWIPECYDICKSSEKRFQIGINVSYLTLFQLYGLPYNKDEYLQIFKQLIEELNRNSISYRLFCNGKKEDYEGGIELINKLGLKEDVMFPQPQTPKELIEQISEFECIVPLRLHAAITAYALGIPSAGFIWNKKVLRFAKIVGMEESFIDIADFSAEVMVENIKKSMRKSLDRDKIECLKKQTLQSIVSFLDTLYYIE